MALESIVTHPGPGTTFTLPLASPALTHSPTSTPSSTLNSPLPINTIQLRRSSYGGVAYPSRSPFPGDSPERSHKELAEKHSELAESLKRSVTIVLWYKANKSPFRLRREIPTFPLLRLSEVEPITSAFGLLANSYIEVYNPDARAWEKEQVCAVRSVESQQRVLFRICQSLIHSPEDSECPGLDAEIRLQEESRCAPTVPLLYHPMDTPTPRKRSADELLTQPLSKHHRSRSVQSSVLMQSSANVIEGSPALPKPAERKSEDPTETPTVEPPSASPTSSPSVRVTPPLMSTASTSESQPRQQSHYMPNTPISPLLYQATNFGPMASLPPRGNPIPISSDSSLAMAVTPPTHTLALQRLAASESPRRPPPSSLPLLSPSRAHAHANPNPTPSPTPASTPLPSTSRLLAPSPSADREPTPATASASAIATATPVQGSAGGAAGAAKAWPHGKYVCEIDAGFTAMEDAMVREPALKQPEAFRRAFGVPHKKSTVCSHKKVWKSAPQDVLQEWCRRGREDGALWSEFVRTVEGKDAKRGAPGTNTATGAGAGMGVGVQSAAAAFGSPQGGVLHLGPGARTTPAAAAGVRIQPVQGLGMRSEEPMAALRPPPQRPMVRPLYFGGDPY